MIINLIAEGFTEEIVATKLLPFCNHELGTVYGRKGCDYIRKNAVIFCHKATEQCGVLVLTDFCDSGAICVAAALQEYVFNKLPNPPETFIFQFAINELESWLLADREGVAKFLGIDVSRMPLRPESEESPKRTLVNLARTSRKKKIREGIAPPPGHHADVGPNYMYLIQKFITDLWDIEAAMQCSPSLERCVRHLREFS